MALTTEDKSTLERILAKLRTVTVDRFRDATFQKLFPEPYWVLGSYIYTEGCYSYQIGEVDKSGRSKPYDYFVCVVGGQSKGSGGLMFLYSTTFPNCDSNYENIKKLYLDIYLGIRRWEEQVKQYKENQTKNTFQSELDKFKKHLG